MENPSIPPTLSPESGLTLPENAPELRAGTWIITLQPTTQKEGNPLIFDGALRIAQRDDGFTVSADIYQRESGPNGESPLDLQPPLPANGIPVFKRSQYRIYWLVSKLTVDTNNLFSMTYQVWEWTASTEEWAANPQTASLEFNLRDTESADGKTYNSNEDADNTVTMKWVSKNYRKITIEIDTVANLEQPLDDGPGNHNWETALDGVADFNLIKSDRDVPEASGVGWSLAEMHATMLQKRDSSDLDSEWRYYVLVVRIIDETERGIMFDTDATDSNNTPREGICIATDWVPPTTGSPDWGLAAGQRWGASKAPYFRTAVHELGHAFGLQHNTSGYMNTSDTYAYEATKENPFPNNIDWFWKPDDLKRLQHWPDVYVRPGGVPFGAANDTVLPNSLVTRDSILSSSLISTSDLVLIIKPILGEIPLGAPVRVDIELVNRGTTPILAPSTISLKSPFIIGNVKDTSNISRSFRPLLYCAEEQPLADLPPGGSVTASLTLLRGGDGSLFPNSGLHYINVELHWKPQSPGFAATIKGSCTVFITAPFTSSHAAAAHRILATPDAHLVLALGGDHLEEGISAIQTCLKDPTLGPHFAAIEARRVACPFRHRKANMAGAQELLYSRSQGLAIMSCSERTKLLKMGLTCHATDTKDRVVTHHAEGQKIHRRPLPCPQLENGLRLTGTSRDKAATRLKY
jgi:hypothetical protein